MRIQSLTYNFKPSFASTTRTTYSSNSGEFDTPFCNFKLHGIGGEFDSSIKLKHSNSTWLARGDLSWKKLPKYFEKRFEGDKVNIHNLACSDGSECYTLAISLIEQLGKKKAQKYFPIKASDVDEKIIEIAKKGEIQASRKDIKRLAKITGSYLGILKYFNVKIVGDVFEDYHHLPGEVEPYPFLLTPKEILRETVEFSCKDAQVAIDEIDSESNNIVLARNFWRYLPPQKLAQTSMDLRRRLSGDDLFILGNFDRKQDYMPYFIEPLGFDYDVDAFFKDSKFQNVLTVKYDCNQKYSDNNEAWQDFISSYYLGYTVLPQDESWDDVLWNVAHKDSTVEAIFAKSLLAKSSSKDS